MRQGQHAGERAQAHRHHEDGADDQVGHRARNRSSSRRTGCCSHGGETFLAAGQAQGMASTTARVVPHRAICRVSHMLAT